VLAGAAAVLDEARRLRGRGIGGGEPVMDWPALISFKRSFTGPVPKEREERFAAEGIDAFHGMRRPPGRR